MSPGRTSWRIAKTQAFSREAMVTAAHPLAVDAGVAALERGGNAMDAAVAASFAGGVVEPYHTGLGGIASILYFEAKSSGAYVIDGTSTLPKFLRPEAFELAESGSNAGAYGWRAVKGDANNTGYLSFITPTALLAYAEALERFGRLGLERAIEPAISLASRGFEIDWFLALTIASQQRRLTSFPQTLRTFFLPDGSCPRARWLGEGPDSLVQADLGRSLELVAHEGPNVFYRGTLGDRLVQDCSASGGFLSAEDLAEASIRFWDKPLACTYRGFEILTLPQNSGGPTLVEALKILEGFDLRRSQSDPQRAHLIAEALRRAFLDRFSYLGDSAMDRVPHDGLISNEFAAVRRRDIDPQRASPGAKSRDPWPFEPEASGAGRRRRGASAATNADDTTNVTVVDRDRNAAVITSTIGSSFGSAVVAADTGILMNNGTLWFNPVRGEFNSLTPGRRNVVAGTPVLILRDGKLVMAGGAAGGRKIISAMLQVILNVIEFGNDIQEAVASPRVHCEGRRTSIDAALGSEIIAGLQRMGHEVEVLDETFGTSGFARPNAIHVGEDGLLRSGLFPHSPTAARGI